MTLYDSYASQCEKGKCASVLHRFLSIIIGVIAELEKKCKGTAQSAATLETYLLGASVNSGCGLWALHVGVCTCAIPSTCIAVEHTKMTGAQVVLKLWKQSKNSNGFQANWWVLMLRSFRFNSCLSSLASPYQHQLQAILPKHHLCRFSSQTGSQSMQL